MTNNFIKTHGEYVKYKEFISLGMVIKIMAWKKYLKNYGYVNNEIKYWNLMRLPPISVIVSQTWHSAAFLW